MTTKVLTSQLRIGMFVADLDRPWVDTPFLLQGFLIEDDDQIKELRVHCEYVIVDRARSTGAEFAPPTFNGDHSSPIRRTAAPVTVVKEATAAEAPTAATADTVVEVRPPEPVGRKVLKLEDIVSGPAARPPAFEPPPDADDSSAPGFFARIFGFLKRKPRILRGAGPPAHFEQPKETREEFEARAALIPPGVPVQTYRDQVSVEQEVPRARAVVAQASELLDKLVADIRLGQSFEVERVEEIVTDMVESIVRNPDALMWVARLRESDLSTYGHGLQVSVYLTAFGRHLGFPKEHLAVLAQVGLLLDIGKIRLPKDLLDKKDRLTPEEFEIAKSHVEHGLEILSGANFDSQVVEAIAQHHERLNGTGYPKGIQGDEICIYGRMAGIADCFSALVKKRPYAEPMSSYEALRALSGWGGELFQEALVQQFISSVGVFPVGSLIELSSGEVAVVVAHNKVRRLKPRVLVVTGPDKTPAPYPTMVDLLYDPKMGGAEPAFIKRGLPAGAYGLDLRDFYLA